MPKRRYFEPHLGGNKFTNLKKIWRNDTELLYITYSVGFNTQFQYIGLFSLSTTPSASASNWITSGGEFTCVKFCAMWALRHSNSCHRNTQLCQASFKHLNTKTNFWDPGCTTKQTPNVYQNFAWSLLATRVNSSALLQIKFLIFVFFAPPYPKKIK